MSRLLMMDIVCRIFDYHEGFLKVPHRGEMLLMMVTHSEEEGHHRHQNQHEEFRFLEASTTTVRLLMMVPHSEEEGQHRPQNEHEEFRFLEASATAVIPATAAMGMADIRHL